MASYKRISLGLDYGMGLTNIDKSNGIRFGVISQNEILQAWVDSSEASYSPVCPECGYQFKKSQYPARCPACRYRPKDESELIDHDADFFYYKHDGYKCFQSGDDYDIFVEKSPYYTYSAFCSPCAPGAGDLSAPFNANPDSDLSYQEQAEKAGFPKTYCLGHDWFDNEKAPYIIYDVKTNKVINP